MKVFKVCATTAGLAFVSAALVVSMFAGVPITAAEMGQKAENDCPVAPDWCADIGNVEDETYHDLRGWGEHRDPAVEIASNGDRSKRYQTVRGDNALKVFIAKPNTPAELVTETEDGACDDSFEIRVNGQSMYTYIADPEKILIASHHVLIPANALPAKSVSIVYRNLATDQCGRAAVFYVRLIPRPT